MSNDHSYRMNRNPQKISFLVRLVKIEGDEYKNLSLEAIDEEGQKYWGHSAKSSGKSKRINFTKLMDQFNHDDLIRLTLEKQVKK